MANHQRWTPERDAELIAMHVAGRSNFLMGERWGISVCAVKNRLNTLRAAGKLPCVDRITLRRGTPWSDERLDVLQAFLDSEAALCDMTAAVNALPGLTLTGNAVRKMLAKLRAEQRPVPMDQRPRVTCIPPARAERAGAVPVVRRPPVVEETPRWMRPRATRVFTMVGVV